jgi:hypothetical protein
VELRRKDRLRLRWLLLRTTTGGRAEVRHVAAHRWGRGIELLLMRRMWTRLLLL